MDFFIEQEIEHLHVIVIFTSGRKLVFRKTTANFDSKYLMVKNYNQKEDKIGEYLNYTFRDYLVLENPIIDDMLIPGKFLGL